MQQILTLIGQCSTCCSPTEEKRAKGSFIAAKICGHFRRRRKYEPQRRTMRCEGVERFALRRGIMLTPILCPILIRVRTQIGNWCRESTRRFWESWVRVITSGADSEEISRQTLVTYTCVIGKLLRIILIAKTPWEPVMVSLPQPV